MDEEDTSKASTVEVPEVDASFPMRSVAIGPVYFNPVVSLIATCSLWGLAGYCMVGLSFSSLWILRSFVTLQNQNKTKIVCCF